MNDRRIFLGMPGYGKQTAQAGRAFWRACSDASQVYYSYQQGSLLAANFNKLWCSALNIVHKGGQLDYFAMLHDDVGPGDGWLDAMIEELEANNLDVLGAVVPIKDSRGMTSLAVAGDDDWMPYARLTMHDVFELPETFTSDDIGRPLLLNTGCWVCKFDMAWADKVHFTINDRIVFNRAADAYQSQTEPEDWCFSRQLHEIGEPGSPTQHFRKLRIGATRKFPLTHRGEMDFHNTTAWGTHAFDSEAVPCSPIEHAFPYDVEGWLTPEEGKKLAAIAEGKKVLEIGSYCGRSTICMARTAKSVLAVDYFDGRCTPKPRDTFVEFWGNLERYGVEDKVLWCRPGNLIEGEFYDVVFIDGDHSRAGVAADIEAYTPMLRPGGVLVFHDYNEPCHPGVTEAVSELLAAGGELVSTVGHLAVVRPPAAIPLEV